jgi:hypothetical protein
LSSITLRRVLVAASMALLSAGLLVTALADGRHAFALSLVMVICGANLWVYSSIRHYGRAMDEAYRFGYDTGYEIGWRQCDAEQQKRAREVEPDLGLPPWPVERTKTPMPPRGRRRQRAG